MKSAIQVMRLAFRDVWDDLWTNLVIHIIWLGCQLLVISGPPATLGLFNYANRVAKGEVTDFRDFWGAMRHYFFTAWRWALVNYFALALLLGDAWLTGRYSQGSLARILQGLYLAGLAAWLLVQIYALPFLLEQTSPSIRLALRNGAVMLGRNIRFSLVLGVLLFVTLLIGIPVFMLSVALGGLLVALASNHAVLDRLEVYRAAPRQPHGLDHQIGEGGRLDV